MTNRTAWPTVGSGDTWTAAQFNLYCRDNDKAYWVFTTAGDLAYATGSAALARLAKGAAGAMLQAGASAPAWTTPKQSQYQINPLAYDEGSPDQAFSGATWVEITGITRTLTLVATSSILVQAAITGYADTSNLTVRAVVNGVADATPGRGYNSVESIRRNEGLYYIYLETGVPSGSRVVKLQSQNSVHVTNAKMVVFAFIE